MLSTTAVTTLSLDSIEAFRQRCIAYGQSMNTAKAYSSDLREFLKGTGLDSIPAQQYETLALTWLNTTRSECAPKTTSRRLTSLRAYAKWANLPNALSDYKAPSPARPIPHPIPERMPGIERMLEKALNAEQRALVGLCGFAGLRISEARAAKVSWFDTRDMMIRVRGKGDKERYVPMSNRCWDAISSAYIEAAIVGPKTKLISYGDRSARKAITSLGRKAGLSRPIASHDLRATLATHLSEQGVQQKVVQEILGHASGATTEIYIGVAVSSMRSAVEI